jgi:hypothetical protein
MGFVHFFNFFSRVREKLNLFLFLFFWSNIRAQRARCTPPGAGWLDGVASDSNRILWRSTNLQRFGPQLGIRPVLDQFEAMGSSESGV